jgi:hypothetical protein
MRSDGTPYYISPEGGATALERVRLDAKNLRESFLQRMLHDHPALLPVKKLDEEFAPLVAVGREIRGIDNLFLSPKGRLAIVETKLWRNPQATREVLAQILEYASRLAAFSYEELESACRAAKDSRMKSGESLYEYAKSAFGEAEVPDESRFVDLVHKNLSTGRFLLLIVGDGIRQDLERILDLLHQQTRLHFTFGLVELQLYRKDEDSGWFIVPQIVAHSTEVVRAVVRKADGVPDSVTVDIPPSEKGKERKLTEDEFLEALRSEMVRGVYEKILHWARDKARVRPAGKSIGIWAPLSGGGMDVIILRLYRNGQMLFTPPKLRQKLKAHALDTEEAHAIWREIAVLFPSLEFDLNRGSPIPAVPAEKVAASLDSLLEIYDRALERIANLEPSGVNGGADSFPDDAGDEEDDEVLR